jgi:hypothetical protein
MWALKNRIISGGRQKTARRLMRWWAKKPQLHTSAAGNKHETISRNKLFFMG